MRNLLSQKPYIYLDMPFLERMPVRMIRFSCTSHTIDVYREATVGACTLTHSHVGYTTLMRRARLCVCVCDTFHVSSRAGENMLWM